MAGLKGTETEKNLLKAFAGESQARNRYTYFASKAKKEGYIQISDIFRKPQLRKRSMLKGSLSSLKEASWRLQRVFPPES